MWGSLLNGVGTLVNSGVGQQALGAAVEYGVNQLNDEEPLAPTPQPVTQPTTVEKSPLPKWVYYAGAGFAGLLLIILVKK